MLGDTRVNEIIRRDTVIIETDVVMFIAESYNVLIYPVVTVRMDL